MQSDFSMVSSFKHEITSFTQKVVQALLNLVLYTLTKEYIKRSVDIVILIRNGVS